MESTIIVVFSCVAGAVLLASLLMSGVLWARLSHVDERQEALAKEVIKETAPKLIAQAVSTAESSRDRIDNALLELVKFKDQIHGEMQRFYAIMRRSEKASGFEKQATIAAAETDSTPPDEVSAASFASTAEPEERESRESLRKRARAAGL